MLKIIRYTIGSLLLFLFICVVLINFTGVQNYLARKGAEYLTKKLNTRVEIAHVRIDFLNHLLIQGLYIEGQSKDTLLYAGEVQVRLTDWFIFKDNPVLHYIGLQNTYAHLYRTSTSKEWNYQFIADAFGSDKKSGKKSKSVEFNIEKAEMENVRIHMDDRWVGEDLDFDVGSFSANARKVDVNKEILDINSIIIKNSGISIHEYKGGRPAKEKRAQPWEPLGAKTPFNPGNWVVSLRKLSLEGCTFRLTSNDKIPEEGHFDEGHLIVTNIMVGASEIMIKGDTLHGMINNMSARERCGLSVKSMHSKVTVSPNASICEDLYLETDYSKMQNYYAMHYRHFPDFNYYIDSVTMVARLDDAIVDERDIAFFAPRLRDFPGVILKVSGSGKGTVANLSAHQLTVTDGSTTIRGNVTMKGLPDIYTTYITFDEGELMTSGAGITKYAPALKDSSTVAIKHIQYAYFKGNYEGYIENFSVKGVINTNLGSLVTDVKMEVPGFNSNTAVYSGSVAANNVQIGNFLNLPLLGNITLDEHFSGRSFNIDDVQLNIDGQIKEFGINGYNYHNITTHGTIAKKQFKGTLLVDDPNLALEFDGGINYGNKNVDILATAHLLGCNFNALNLTKDTVTLSADFDLNCTGSNIDNFAGYAKLNNIDLKRNTHKLAIDSILLTSTGDTVKKVITIRSNDVVASIRGDYQLSSLPASVQLYLSGYIPNYIKAPVKYAPNQNIEFSVKTGTIDSILAVTIPLLRGFDASEFSGSLNTTTQKLTLNATVPHGSVGKFHMNNVALTGDGNFSSLGLNTTIDNVVIGDSALNGSLSLTTTVAHDSIAFTIATTTPDTSSTLTLNGRVIAKQDSLFLTVFPSTFYLNKVKWDIAGGSRVVYTNKYLSVDGFSITSGPQKITASTEISNDGNSIVIQTTSLDLGQFGSWAGLSAYQPDGRVNGTVKIVNVFGDLVVTANVRATEVKFGSDTVGTVTIIGSYDDAKQLINLDPQTGIFYKGASVLASGKISFDSTSHQKLDGKIEFKDAPVAWSSPFLVGIMSHLKGTINGSVALRGSAQEPELDGAVSLKEAGFRLDYMGCNYTIPYANVKINNSRIEFGKVMIFDRLGNFAFLTGNFRHRTFKRMRFHLNLETRKFEVMNLASYDNSIFYGNAIVSMDSLTLRGPFDNIRLAIHGVAPAARSTVYMPVTSGSELGTYSYVSFKNYGKEVNKALERKKDKFSISIDANLNPLAEMVVVLDPTNGDEIRARGEGRILMDLPANNEMSINGLYRIESGTYNFTLNQFFIHRTFLLDEGSVINFQGPFSATTLEVDGKYRVKAKLSDLLINEEKLAIGNELNDAQTPQWVDILLHMDGLLTSPKLTFKLDLEDKHSQNSVAYQKLNVLNNDTRQQLAQVGSLLLVGQFVPPEGISAGTVTSGAINNISQIFSNTASTGLTAILNRLTGDKDLNVAVKYTNYNYSDQNSGGITRNEIKLGVNKSLFNDKLIVEVGSTADWGRPTSTSSSSNFNFTGDFRIQYKITKTGNMRLNAFRTSDYDITLDRDIVRSGVGVTWRKSFDNLGEFFHGRKYAQRMKEQETSKQPAPQQDSLKRTPPGVTD